MCAEGIDYECLSQIRDSNHGTPEVYFPAYSQGCHYDFSEAAYFELSWSILVLSYTCITVYSSDSCPNDKPVHH